jgi:hypothetical protein
MAEETGKHIGGRPSKYQDDFARMAHVACVEGGFTDRKLADLFNVTRRTIDNWKREHPEFFRSIKAGKDKFDSSRVETAFLKSCLGIRFTETTKEPLVLGDSQEPGKLVVTKKVQKFIAPNPKACMDWLCNRQPDRWKKLKHVELSGKDGRPVQTESMVAVPSGPMSIADWEKEVTEARKKDKPFDPAMLPGTA